MMEIWKEWKKNPNNDELKTKLLDALNPIIFKEINRWSRGIGAELVYPTARKLALQAARTYDPKSGTSLTTHVVNQLKPLSRIAYSYQDVVRIPEYKLLRLMHFNNSMRELKDQLGREPTINEIAEHLKISRSAALRLWEESRRGEILEDIEMPMYDSIMADPNKLFYIDFLYQSLTPRQQKVFEYSTGYNGAPKLSVEEIAKKINESPSVVYKERYRIADYINKHLKYKL
jgi:DNA-directed RNA polymerase specialized sigma subunit